jgi:signal transduction histidine kinase
MAHRRIGKPQRSRLAVVLLAMVLASSGLCTAARSQPQTRALPAAAPSARPAAQAYRFAETRQIVELVDAAVAEIESRGEEAYADLRRSGSRWYQDDTYVFVWELNGNRLVYPPDPSGEQTNQSGLTDTGGKPIGRLFLEAARSASGYGWVHYQWPRPGQATLEWKSTYIRRATTPDGLDVLVGSGHYQPRIEELFVVAEVDAAARLIAEQGRSAFSVIRDPRNRFYFHDTYVFVITPAGEELVNPAFPGLEGKNVLDIKDANGRLFVREFVSRALTRGSGWVSYLWPRPEEPSRPVHKLTYVKQVTTPDGESLIVAAGLYPTP